MLIENIFFSRNMKKNERREQTRTAQITRDTIDESSAREVSVIWEKNLEYWKKEFTTRSSH